MANLFDVATVFSVAVLMALVTRSAANRDAPLAENRAPGDQRQTTLEKLRNAGVPIPRFRVTKDALSGRGERLGTAYRLATGEVVYVPDK